MNVRFSAQAVRCRVTRTELDLLLLGRAVTLQVALPGEHKFRVNIRPGVLAAGSPGTRAGWQLDSDPTGLWLTVPRAQLESLAQSLPNKAGISQTFDTSDGDVRVTFEVDLHERGE
jgi:hypothetical protein